MLKLHNSNCYYNIIFIGTSDFEDKGAERLKEEEDGGKENVSKEVEK